MPPSDAPFPPPPPPADGRLGRLGLEFYLDLIQIGRRGGDLLGPLLLAVVVEANTASVSRDTALQMRYATLEEPPPDELRRPISINGVAASLRLPFETVRRRLHGLAQDGQCVIGPEGVVVTTAMFTNPHYAQVALDRWRLLRQLLRQVEPGDENPPALAMAWEGGGEIRAGEPVRLCNRLIGEYFLRVTDAMLGELGDAMSAFIALGLVRAKLAHRPVEAGDEEPIAPGRLARTLGLPAETTRRRLLELERRGLVTRMAVGVTLAQSADGAALADRTALACDAALQRLLWRLEALGVLARWRAERLIT